MKIVNTSLRSLSISIKLAEAEFFDINYDSSYRSRERDTALQVQGLRALVDLEDGEVQVEAMGYLRNKSGAVGERDRSQYLTEEQIPEEAKGVIAEEARTYRERIAGVTGVTYY